MQTRRDFVAWLSAISLAGLTRPLGADESAEKKAARAARSWLHLVDTGRYGASWEVAAQAFKRSVTPEQWDQAVHSVRTPLGRCLSRTLRSHKLVDSPRGAPKGPYVVLQFETNFERRGSAVETVTPVLGRDDRWRVASYFIS
jgi:hypothetical protein